MVKTEERTLDCRGLACPQPVVRTREALEALGDGPLRVILDNEGSCSNVMRFAQNQGHQVQMEEQVSDFHLVIQKGAGVAETEDQPIVCETPQKRATVVYISSGGMGRGDEQLGSILMAAYLDTLSQFAPQISHVIFVNAGVKLAVEDSPVLEQIQGLERVGVQILCCGTCLKHFGIQEKLKAGSVSNMYAILEVLSAAGKVMSP